jgi:tRNA(Arg) A34 adenosine deaminase TadA
MLPLLLSAAELAVPHFNKDPRNFWLGAVGLREDGASVYSRNGAVSYSASVEAYHLNPNSHAEGRLLRKLGKNGIVYVARVFRKDRTLAMARPCGMCQTRLRAFNVEKVYYTIDNNHYGIWYPKKDKDKIIEC